MSAKINPSQRTPFQITPKTISWRVLLSILILSFLAGPGAELLQKLVSP